MIASLGKFTSPARILLVLLAIEMTLAEAQIPAKPPITALARTPDGNAILAGSQATLQLRSWPDLLPSLDHTVHQQAIQLGQIQDLQFSPDGKRLLIAGGRPSEQGEWRLVDWPSATLVAANTNHDDVIYSAVWLTNDRFVTGAADHAVIEWQLNKDTAQEIRRLKGHSRRVLAVEYCQQANLLMSAGVDQTIRVWRVGGDSPREPGTERPLRILDNHTGPIRDLALRPGDHAVPYLASASADKTVRFWQPSIGRLVRFARLPVEPLAITWTMDGERLVASCIDGHVRIINPNTVEIEETNHAIDGWAYALLSIPNQGLVVAGTANAMTFIPLD